MSGLITQGNKTFFSMERGGQTIYYVSTIDGRNTRGREGSYMYIKCKICCRIIGTQFNAHLKHYNSHNH